MSNFTRSSEANPSVHAMGESRSVPMRHIKININRETEAVADNESFGEAK